MLFLLAMHLSDVVNDVEIIVYHVRIAVEVAWRAHEPCTGLISKDNGVKAPRWGNASVHIVGVRG